MEVYGTGIAVATFHLLLDYRILKKKLLFFKLFDVTVNIDTM
jgi:hypothetical protein